MGNVVVFTNLTLDGVMQAPGRPDEDTRGGFAHGGWAMPYAAMQEAGDSTAFTGGLLLGRRTYEDFYGYWPEQTGNPFSEALNQMPKYIASRTLQEPLAWQNSTLLQGDAAAAVAQLKQDTDLLIMGSGELVRSLIPHNLVDEYTLLIHPLVLGSGSRLFPDGGPRVDLQLVEARPTSKGVVIASYRPVEQAPGQPS